MRLKLIALSCLLGASLWAAPAAYAQDPAPAQAAKAHKLAPAIVEFQPIQRAICTARQEPDAASSELHALIRARNLYQLKVNRPYEGLIARDLNALLEHAKRRKGWSNSSYVELKLSAQELATAGISEAALERGLMARIVPESMLPNKDTGAKWRVRVEPLKKSRHANR